MPEETLLTSLPPQPHLQQYYKNDEENANWCGASSTAGRLGTIARKASWPSGPASGTGEKLSSEQG